MTSPEQALPDLSRLRGVVAPEILNAVEIASAMLRDAGVPHALAGGLAVGAHGYPRTTDDVDFLVGDEAFEKHAGGLVTLRVPLIAVGKVRIDLVPIDTTTGEREQLRPAVENPPLSEQIPIVPMHALIYMKLKANRQKDMADLVELLKRGRIEADEIDHHLARSAPELMRKWDHVRKAAAAEE